MFQDNKNSNSQDKAEFDPVNVGLKKIIRSDDNVKSQETPLQYISFPEFDTPNSTSAKRKLDEQRILLLEEKNKALEAQITKLKNSLNAGVQNAYNKGYEVGLQKGTDHGHASAESEYNKKINQLQAKISEFLISVEASKRQIFQNSEHILVRLSMEIAKKVLNTELTTNSEIVLGNVKKALSYIGDREKVLIRIAPSDYETVTNRKDFWVPITDKLTNIEIQADERIEKGGCIIDSNSGVVDARLGVQFNEIVDLLESIWENSTAQMTGEK